MRRGESYMIFGKDHVTYGRRIDAVNAVKNLRLKYPKGIYSIKITKVESGWFPDIKKIVRGGRL